MRKILGLIYVFLLLFLLITLTSCSNYGQGDIQKVGMLVENSINDQTWGNKGYKGLVEIKDELNVDVYFKEDIKTQQEVNRAVEQFSAKGVNLIFGHSNIYGKMFEKISDSYPNIHFVYFNGGYYADNLTSLNFSSHAMGFFGGMVAGKMTKTNQVGIIAAYEWQPEIEGFYEGVNYQNPNANVQMDFVNSWDNSKRASELFEKMNKQNVDVFYPAGDSFSIRIINQAKEAGKYAIGFVSDQIGLGKSTVLTSTVQQVDNLYLLAAKQFNEGELEGGVFTYDFNDGVITMGEFSPEVPNSFKMKLEGAIERYKETGLLPNES
ncbi:BMP family ABC transporter substrate-binding protein [Aquibacillus sp. 3ASR75-54]|uniref:BMP family ABC transporter substrate-binding protein n=1 Tax=Aquibacillus salsiterrae TaxID=2950439 RepID=A0A9X3WEZ0_9BACI|nr:BMP family ABC transporter substrate-binding protein [Aquibacillus salsiterrae]MDC3417216.1 BMP family ABC transporter substrate-binding protein [Aquibacillus salsiterrae]